MLGKQHPYLHPCTDYTILRKNPTNSLYTLTPFYSHYTLLHVSALKGPSSGSTAHKLYQNFLSIAPSGLKHVGMCSGTKVVLTYKAHKSDFYVKLFPSNEVNQIRPRVLQRKKRHRVNWAPSQLITVWPSLAKLASDTSSEEPSGVTFVVSARSVI